MPRERPGEDGRERRGNGRERSVRASERSPSTRSVGSSSTGTAKPSRRRFLAGVGAAGLGGLAGCMGFQLQSASNREPPLVENRPDAVYLPTHTEGMQMVGMTGGGAYRCMLSYTWPHRFWTVTGRNTNQVDIGDGDTAHLMATVWHADAGIVTPDVSPAITVRQGGERVLNNNPWPMLSQPMGFHFGDNVQLPGEGEYQVEVSVGEPSNRRTGSLADAGRATFEFSMAFSQSKLEELRYTDISEEREGTRGAVPMMEMNMGSMGMGMPSTKAPEENRLPGTVRGSGTSGDAAFVVTVLDDATPFGGGENDVYLAVSPRTPHNRYVMPLMSLSATLRRGSETVYDDVLTATLDADLSYHYGAVVSEVADGDELTITVDAPPQVSRHEGYETAFIRMQPLSLTL